MEIRKAKLVEDQGKQKREDGRASKRHDYVFNDKYYRRKDRRKEM